MQKLTGTSSGKNNKSCRIFHHESKKIGFAFFWCFYDFLRNLQESAKYTSLFKLQLAVRPLRFFDSYADALTLRLTPWKEISPHNVTPRGGGRRGWSKFRRARRRLGRGSGRGVVLGWLGPDLTEVRAVGVGVLDRQPTKGSARSRWMWLAEIGNSKEETRGTQFRPVRAAGCVIPYVLYAA
jgi:hypothetical protein